MRYKLYGMSISGSLYNVLFAFKLLLYDVIEADINYRTESLLSFNGQNNFPFKKNAITINENVVFY